MVSNIPPPPPSDHELLQAFAMAVQARDAQVAAVSSKLEMLAGKCAYCFGAGRDHNHVRSECTLLTEQRRQEFRESFCFDPANACLNCGRTPEYCDTHCHNSNSAHVVRDMMLGMMEGSPARLNQLMQAAGKNVSQPGPGSTAPTGLHPHSHTRIGDQFRLSDRLLCA